MWRSVTQPSATRVARRSITARVQARAKGRKNARDSLDNLTTSVAGAARNTTKEHRPTKVCSDKTSEETGVGTWTRTHAVGFTVGGHVDSCRSIVIMGHG